MKPLKIVCSIALAVATLASCSVQKPSPIEYNYQIENARANGIVQVFDLGGNTIVQIRGMNLATTRFFDQRNVEIPHRVVGENVVLKGIMASFTVSTATAASRVVRTVPVPQAAIQKLVDNSVAAGSSGLPKRGASDEMSNGQLLAEIARIKKEIAELKGVIASASSDLAIAQPQPAGAAFASSKAESMTKAGAKTFQGDGEIIRVFFKDNSQFFRPNTEEKNRILGLVKNAKTIEVIGYTDSTQATDVSESLAKGRAQAAKRYLIRRGIDGKKITVDYAPAGKFLSDNDTEKGRASNRRVEIRAS